MVERLLSGGGSFIEGGIESTEDGAGHFHESGGVEKRENFDGKTEDEAEGAGGGGNNGPSGEAGGAKKQAEEGVEDEHLSENIFPFAEVFFGVGQEVGDEGKGRDHDEEGNDGLAGGDGEETGDDGDEGGEDGRNEEPEEGAKTTRGGNGNGGASDGAGAEKEGSGGGTPTEATSARAGLHGGLFNATEEAVESTADNITDVDGEGAEEETEIDKDGGDNDAREDGFDVVITEADAGDLGVDNNNHEDDKDNIGDVFEVAPDDGDLGRTVESEGFDLEDVGDGGVEGIDAGAEALDYGANEPADTLDLVGAFGGFFGLVGFGLTVGLGFGGVFRLSGVRVLGVLFGI